MASEKDFLKNNDLTEAKLKNVPVAKLFDRFGTPYTKFLTKESFQKIKQYPNWDGVLLRNIKNIKTYVKAIENWVNIKFSKKLGTSFSVSNYTAFYADQNMPYVMTKMNVTQLGKNIVTPVMINIPLDRLVTLPPMELYSLLAAPVTSAALTVQNNIKGKVIDITLEDEPDHTLSEKIEKIDNINDKIENNADNEKKAHKILTKYLMEFLPSACGGEYDEFYNISTLVATQLLDGLTPKEIENLITSNFDISSLEDEALKQVGIFAGKDVSELRTNKLHQKAQDLWKDPNKEPEALGVTKQYEALMSIRLKDDFIELANKTGKPKSNDVDLKKFCQEYADTYMESNGLKPIKLTFKNEGELGTYYDAGESQRINVNLSKITSVTELISTLSHELTHAVESSINKSKGNVTEEGYGLDDNMSFDISQASVPTASPEYELLKELNMYCYRLNPHERSARYGEISGLKFMHALAKTDEMKQQLFESVEMFKTYQRRTLSVIEKLSDSQTIANLDGRVNNMLNSQILTSNDKQMIIERMKYIKRMMAEMRLEKTLEQKSLEEIEKISVNSKAQEIELLEQMSR